MTQQPRRRPGKPHAKKENTTVVEKTSHEKKTIRRRNETQREHKRQPIPASWTCIYAAEPKKNNESTKTLKNASNATESKSCNREALWGGSVYENYLSPMNKLVTNRILALKGSFGARIGRIATTPLLLRHPPQKL